MNLEQSIKKLAAKIRQTDDDPSISKLREIGLDINAREWDTYIETLNHFTGVTAPNLEVARLTGGRIGNFRDFQGFKAPKLKYLHLSNNHIPSFVGIGNLDAPNLEMLNLRKNDIVNYRGFEELLKFPKLNFINLTRNGLQNPDAMAELRKIIEKHPRLGEITYEFHD